MDGCGLVWMAGFSWIFSVVPLSLRLVNMRGGIDIERRINIV